MTENQEKELKKSTVAEYGFSLPYGIEDHHTGLLNKSFTLKPVSTKSQKDKARVVDAFRKKAKTVLPVMEQVVAMAEAIESFEGDDPNKPFCKTGEHQRRKRLLGLKHADHAYLWTQMRIETLGPEYSVIYTCQNRSCEGLEGTVNSFDLNDLPLTSCDRDESIGILEYKLRKPFDYGEGQCTIMKLRTPSVSFTANMEAGSLPTMQTMGSDAVDSAIVAAVITGSRGDEDVPATTGLKDQIHPLDWEMLVSVVSEAIDKVPGLDTELEFQCKHCRESAKHDVNTGTDFFFGASSLPRN